MTPEWAWATGIYEGEGTCGRFRNGGEAKFVTAAQIIMADEEIVKRFHEVVCIGSVRGPFHYKNSVQPLWRWRANAHADLLMMFETMWPLLGERRRAQAAPVLEYIRADTERRRLLRLQEFGRLTPQ